VSAADERLVAASVASNKICFGDESQEILHVFQGNSAKGPLYEEFYYNVDFSERLRNISIMNNSELSRNFGISHGKFH
jgi:hypothetical protein